MYDIMLLAQESFKNKLISNIEVSVCLPIKSIFVAFFFKMMLFKSSNCSKLKDAN